MTKNKFTTFLEKSFYNFIFIAPAVLFFSYYPIFLLGSNSTMNFELSLPLIWLVLFDLIAFFLLIKKRLIRNIFKYWAWALFPLFLTISIFWSPNLLRGILEIGILWLLYFAGFSIYELRFLFEQDNARTKFYKYFFCSTLFICFWCLLQCILDLVGVSHENTLMCAGCTYQMFGFPHPNGFAIEPQFMGNLLLAPVILSLYLLITNSEVINKKRLIVYSIIIITTFFLTFSRGAIYAFAVAFIFLIIAYLVKQKSASCLKSILIIAVSFLLALNFQGLFAEISPTDETYFSGIAKSLNHLSLGIIDIRPKEPQPEKTTTDEAKTESTVFDGYVKSSTDTRVSLNDAAIAIWQKDAKTVLLGVGLGGAGEALYENHSTNHPKEIVQNQFFSLLLETGLIGIGLLLFTLFLIIKYTKNQSNFLLYTLMISYGVSLCFFAGLPNALHIYLLPLILYQFERN